MSSDPNTTEAEAEEQGGLAIYGFPVRGRSCGSCKLCCTLVPAEIGARPDSGGVEEWKAAGQRCRFLCSKGCSIYEGRPDPCRYWSCRWLFDDATAAMRRPDHVGYVIDPQPDTVVADGRHPYDVLQVWVDPARRDAHRDPALRDYLDRIAVAHGLPALVRYNSHDGFLLIPPSMNSSGDWIEMEITPRTEADLNVLLEAAGHPLRNLEGKARLSGSA